MYKKDSCKDSFHETHETHETVGDKTTKEALDALRLDIELGKIVEKLDEKFPGLVVYKDKEKKIIFTDKVQEYDVNEIFKTIFFTKVEKKETSSEQEEDEYDFNIFEVNYQTCKNDAIKLILNETYYMAPIHTMTLDSHKDATFTTVHNENKVQLYYQNPTGDVLGNALLVEGMELSLVNVLPRRQYQHIGPQEYKFNIEKTDQEKEKEQELASEIDQEKLKNGISDFLQSMEKYQKQYPDDQATKDLIQLLEKVQGIPDGSITQGKLQTIVTELLQKIQGQAKYPKEAYDTMIKILEFLDTRVDPQQLKQGINLLSTTIANYALDNPDNEDCKKMKAILNAALTSVDNAIKNHKGIGKENIINDIITPFLHVRKSFKRYKRVYSLGNNCPSATYVTNLNFNPYQYSDALEKEAGESAFKQLQTIFFGTTQEQNNAIREFGTTFQISDKTQTSFLADHMVYTEVINNQLTIKTLDKNEKENGYQEFLNSVQETFDITADDTDENGEINQNSEKIQKINRLYEASLKDFNTFTACLLAEISSETFPGIKEEIKKEIKKESGIGKNILAFQKNLRDKQRNSLKFTKEAFLKPQKERRLQLHNQNLRTLQEEVEYNTLTHDLTSNDDETKKRQNTNYRIAKNYHLYGEIGSNLKVSLFPYYAKLADGVEGNNKEVYNNIVGLDGNISDKNAKIYGDIGLEISIFIATTLITGGIGGVIGEGLLTLGSLSRYKNLASICQKAANAMLKTQKLQTFKTLSFGEQLGGTSLNGISKLTEARFFNNIHNLIKSGLKGTSFDFEQINPFDKENIQTAVFLCLLGAGNKLKGFAEKKLLNSMANEQGISIKELLQSGFTSLQKAGFITGEVTFDALSMLAAEELMNLTFGYEIIDPNTGEVITERGFTCPTQGDIVKIVGMILGSKAVQSNLWSEIHGKIKEKQWKICKTPNSDTYVFYNIITNDMIVSDIKGENPVRIKKDGGDIENNESAGGNEKKVENGFIETSTEHSTYFEGKTSKCNFSKEDAENNSTQMDERLNDLENGNLSLDQVLKKMKTEIETQYMNKMNKKLELTEDQLLSIIDAHEQEGPLGEITIGQLHRKVKILDETITDEDIRRFLLEGGFCGKIENYPQQVYKERKNGNLVLGIGDNTKNTGIKHIQYRHIETESDKCFNTPQEIINITDIIGPLLIEKIRNLKSDPIIWKQLNWTLKHTNGNSSRQDFLITDPQTQRNLIVQVVLCQKDEKLYPNQILCKIHSFYILQEENTHKINKINDHCKITAQRDYLHNQNDISAKKTESINKNVKALDINRGEIKEKGKGTDKILTTIQEALHSKNSTENLDQIFNDLLEYIKQNKGKEGFQQEILDIVQAFFSELQLQTSHEVVYNRMPRTSFDEYMNKSLGGKLCQLMTEEGGTCKYRTLFFKDFFDQINTVGDFGRKNQIMYNKNHSGMYIKANNQMYFVDRYSGGCIQKITDANSVKVQFQQDYTKMIDDVYELDLDTYLKTINTTKKSPNTDHIKIKGLDIIFQTKPVKFDKADDDNIVIKAIPTLFDGNFDKKKFRENFGNVGKNFGENVYKSLLPEYKIRIDQKRSKEAFIDYLNNKVSQETLRNSLFSH